MRRIRIVVGLLVCLGFCGAASATLIDRGNGLIYDDVLDITWLQDPSLGASNTFGLATDVSLGTHPTDNSGISGIVSASGLMNWPGALFRLDAINADSGIGYLGFNDWRLPITTQPDLACSQVDAFAGFPLQGSNDNCTGSEMGHLFYVDGITQVLPGPFLDFADFNWSGTEFAQGC